MNDASWTLRLLSLRSYAPSPAAWEAYAVWTVLSQWCHDRSGGGHAPELELESMLSDVERVIDALGSAL